MSYDRYPPKKSRISRALSSGKWSDFTICCGKHEFRVHRIVLAERSDFFDTLCSQGMFVEGDNGRCVLPEDNPSLICRMLSTQYDDVYSTEDIYKDSEDEPIVQFADVHDDWNCAGEPTHKKAILHMEMYRLGDKYDLERVKDYALRQFVRVLHGEDPSNPDVTVKIDESRVSNMKHIVEAVYDLDIPTAMVLRVHLLEILHEWIDHYDAMQIKAFRDLLQQNPRVCCDFMLFPMSEVEAVCSSKHCGKRRRVIVGECACGHRSRCEDHECQHKWEADSVCGRCFKLGKMKYPHGGW
jgi:hypothetical protein